MGTNFSSYNLYNASWQDSKGKNISTYGIGGWWHTQDTENYPPFTNDDEKNSGQVNKVREMINFTNKSSFNNEFKIVLIDNVELLNINSINALLKIVEEPNSNLYFFLIHNNNVKILDTLNSKIIIKKIISKITLIINKD